MASTTSQDEADRAVMRAMAAKMLAGSAAPSSAGSSAKSTSPRTMPRTAYVASSSRASANTLQENLRPTCPAQGFGGPTADASPISRKRSSDEALTAAPKQTPDAEYKGPSLFGTADQLKEARMFSQDATRGGNKSRVRSTRSERAYSSRTTSPLSSRSIDNYTTRAQSAPRNTTDSSFRAPHMLNFGNPTGSSIFSGVNPSTQAGHTLARAVSQREPASPAARPNSVTQVSQPSTSTPMEGVEPAVSSASHATNGLQTEPPTESVRVASTTPAPSNRPGAVQPPHLSKVSKPVAVESKPLQSAVSQPVPESKPLQIATPQSVPESKPSNELKPGSIEWMKAIGDAAKQSTNKPITEPKADGEVTKSKALGPTMDVSKMLETLSVFKKSRPAITTEDKAPEVYAEANSDVTSQLKALTARVTTLETANTEIQAAVLRLQETEVRRKFLGTDKGREAFEITVHLPSHGIKVLIPTKMEDRIGSLIRAATARVAVNLTGKDPRLSFEGKQVGHMMLVGEVGITAGDTVDVSF